MIDLDNDILNCLECITERTSFHSVPQNLIGFDESITYLNNILNDSVQEKKSNIVLVTGASSSVEQMMCVFKSIVTIPETTDYSKEWNVKINELFEDQELIENLNDYFDINQSFPNLFKLIIQSLYNIDNDSRFLTKPMILESIKQSKRTWLHDTLMISESLGKLSCLAGIQTLLKYRLIKQEGTNFGEFIQFRLTLIDFQECETVVKSRSDCPNSLKNYICSWLQ
ncbi:hypothetical protein PPL_01957 [Heterostelium album PN500]|uniref:Origin recognition complex subunit 4 C-terminal domain-containing protein n=1 Tax=Heterostelium pallidum (strain ATCC 26659 / Pp 5 / PN500) TaxID=670386 RepID=D3B0Z0_HETP5|nr:hypothetical protein PPL_01957 [Heterostelium album PN500]EFA84964.1 hypothetical protein PPL_01957 [Heterostelium album PN500]|eukprot:XP_020437074.1 hypothetical protein PPL_01957 [Heterostelium album PN500]